MQSRLVLTMVVASVVLAGDAFAQREAPPLEADPATVTGLIRAQRTGDAIPGAELFVDGSAMGRTDDKGRFTIYLGPGQRILEVRRIGFAPAVAKLILEGGARLDLVIELPERAVQMDTIVIEGRRSRFGGKLAGFYDRQQNWGFGQFFGPQDLETITVSRLSDLFHRAKSVDVECLDSACTSRALRGTNRSGVSWRGGPCYMEYYVDGMPWNPGPAGLDVLNPEAVAAVEVYPAPHTVPVQFGGRRAQCGVVVFWTKAGL